MSDTTPDIRELTGRVASGQPEAFAEFYERYFDHMYREAWRVCRQDEAFCLDVVQDAMLKVIRSIPTLDGEGRLRVWLRQVVRSCALDRLRSETRRRRRESEAVPAGPVTNTPGHDPHHDDESVAWLRDELDGFDRVQSQMLVLRYKLGWTLKRIGARFDLTPSAVDGRIKRLIDDLRARAPEWFDER